MRQVHARIKQERSRAGFSLVEASLSLGIMSFGLLTLVPLLALGIKTSRLARDDQGATRIAQTLIQAAQQGTTLSGVTYLDDQGAPCAAAQATYTALCTTATIPGSSSTRKTFLITPVGAPDRVRTYAVILPP